MIIAAFEQYTIWEFITDFEVNAHRRNRVGEDLFGFRV